MIAKLNSISQNLLNIAEKLGEQKLEDWARMVKNKIEMNECYIIVVGETSSGKSTLIDSLVNKNLIPVSVTPNTGQIIELSISNYNKDQYFQVRSNDNLKEISLSEFKKLSSSSDLNIIKLRANLKNSTKILNDIYILDTPGYNSIISNHDEVLLDFIPQSDVIIYMVNYRKGITQTDIKYLKDIYNKNEDIKQIYFVVNWKENSNNDRRITEIKNYLKSNFEYSGKIYIPIRILKNGFNYLDIPELWKDIQKFLRSSEREEIIEENKKNLILELILRLNLKIEKINKINSLTYIDVSKIKQLIDSEKKNKDEALSIIREKYIEINEEIERKINSFFLDLKNRSKTEIDNRSVWAEPISPQIKEYLLKHFLPSKFRSFNIKLQNYIEKELNCMEDQLNEIADASIRKIDDLISISNDPFEKTKQGFIKQFLKVTIKTGTKKYLGKLGGRGGYKAGFYNMAKKSVSKFGKVFGKKFPREFYDNLGRTLKRIGLKIDRSLGIFITVISESILYLFNVSTWKASLIKKINQAIKKSKSNLLNDVTEALIESQNYNIDVTEEIFSERIAFLKDILKKEEQKFLIEPELLMKFQKEINNMMEVLKNG